MSGETDNALRFALGTYALLELALSFAVGAGVDGRVAPCTRCL